MFSVALFNTLMNRLNRTEPAMHYNYFGVFDGLYRFLHHYVLFTEVRALIKALLRHKPERRPTLDRVLADRWLEEAGRGGRDWPEFVFVCVFIIYD